MKMMKKKAVREMKKLHVGASIIGAIAILIFVMSTASAIAPVGPVVRVEPATQTLVPGTPFSVNVTIQDVTEMAANQGILHFDPAAMQATTIIEGEFMKTGGSTLPVTNIDNTAGTALFAYTLWPSGNVSGSGVLTTIEFTTNASAECTFGLNLTDVIFSNGTGADIPIAAIYNGTVKLDNTPPTVEIHNPANNTWFDAEPVNVTFHLWDAKAEVLNYTVFLDDIEADKGTVASCTNTTVGFGILSEGNHVIRVNATDDVGWEGSAEVTIHVDLTPPQVEILAPASGTWVDSEPFNISFRAWDNKADTLTYQILADSSELANGAAANDTVTNVSINLTVLGDCDHVLRVNVTDKAGKTNSSEVTIHVDLTPPTVEILAPANDSWLDSEPFNFSFIISDNKAATLAYKIFDDMAEIANGTATNGTVTNVSINPTELGDCDHLLRVTATDSVNKTNFSEVTIHIDLTPPTVEILAPVNGTWFDSESFNLSFLLQDNKAVTLNYSIFDGPTEIANGTATNGTVTNVSINPTVLGDCDHLLRVTATDSVGKTNSSEVTIHIDLTPPTVEILAPANDSWLDSEPFNFSFLISDNKATTLAYAIFDGLAEIMNGTAANGIITNVSLDPTIRLGAGDHVLRVNVTDMAGKMNSSEITIHIDLSLMPPQIEILEPVNDSWFDSEPFNLSFLISDNMSTTLNYTIFDGLTEIMNGTADNRSITNISLKPQELGECDHLLRVTATNQIGKKNSSEVTIHVDLTPPQVEILAPANNSWFDSEPLNLSFLPWDNKADQLEYWVYVDNVEKANGTAANDSTVEVNLSYLPECEHVIRVNVTDYVGKTNFTEVTIHVDLTPPTVEILAPANGTWFDSEPFNLSFRPQDNKAVTLNYSILDGLTEIANGTATNGSVTNVSINPVVLGDCDHVLRVNVTDMAGKTGFDEVCIHIDLSPAQVEILEPANDSWFDAEPVNLSFKLSDNKAATINYSVYLDNVEQVTGSAANGTIATFGLGILTECNHVIRVTATDSVGKTNSSEITIHVDLTAPTVEILEPANDSWFDSENVTVTFLPCDNKAATLNYSIFVNGVEKANGTATNCTNETVNLGVLPDECANIIRINVTDTVGKTNSSEVTVWVDLTPPIVQLLLPGEAGIYGKVCVPLNFSAQDTGACPSGLNTTGAYYVLDGGAPVNISGNDTIRNLAACGHTLVLYVEDNVGNENSTTVNFTVHPADIFGDGTVNVIDLQLLAWSFGRKTSDPYWNPGADLNCDGQVNIFDLQILAWNFLKDYSSVCI